MCSGRGYNIYIYPVAAEGAGNKRVHRRDERKHSAINPHTYLHSGWVKNVEQTQFYERFSILSPQCK
jgi:hypothetical protein